MWEQIAANRRRSMLLITGMMVILVLMGLVAGGLVAEIFRFRSESSSILDSGPSMRGSWFFAGGGWGVAVAFAFWAILMLIYFWSAETVLLHGANATEIQREDSPRLFNIVEEMSIAAGLGFTPRVYLIDDPAPNAFAIGRKPETSAIGVTTGLLHRLNRDELQGVIAHEIAHIKNRDVQFMTLAAVLLGTSVVLGEILWELLHAGSRGTRRSSSRGGGGGAAILLAILVAVIVVALARLMQSVLYAVCSRKREFLADACGAQFTRYPEGLASALEKISRARAGVSFASKATAPMFIVNPLRAATMDEPLSIFATHPPTSERVRILRSMGNASLAAYQSAYQSTHGSGALFGAATLQKAPAEAIRDASGEGPIETRHETRAMAYRANGYIHLTCNCGLAMNVPESFERNEVVCVRCGMANKIPAVKERLREIYGIEPKPATPPVIPLQYKRAGAGWESFRCSCGRTVQISPAFSGAHVRCTNCRQKIEVQ